MNFAIVPSPYHTTHGAPCSSTTNQKRNSLASAKSTSANRLSTTSPQNNDNKGWQYSRQRNSEAKPRHKLHTSSIYKTTVNRRNSSLLLYTTTSTYIRKKWIIKQSGRPIIQKSRGPSLWTLKMHQPPWSQTAHVDSVSCRKKIPAAHSPSRTPWLCLAFAPTTANLFMLVAWSIGESIKNLRNFDNVENAGLTITFYPASTTATAGKLPLLPRLVPPNRL